MDIRVIATNGYCTGGDCPTIYAVEGTEDVLVQGYVVTDPHALAKVGLPDGETLVRIPKHVLDQAAATDG